MDPFTWPSKSRANYIQQLCGDTECSSEDPPEAMNDREEWRERESGISVLAAPQEDNDDDDFA